MGAYHSHNGAAVPVAASERCPTYDQLVRGGWWGQPAGVHPALHGGAVGKWASFACQITQPAGSTRTDVGMACSIHNERCSLQAKYAVPGGDFGLATTTVSCVAILPQLLPLMGGSAVGMEHSHDAVNNTNSTAVTCSVTSIIKGALTGMLLNELMINALNSMPTIQLHELYVGFNCGKNVFTMSNQLSINAQYTLVCEVERGANQASASIAAPYKLLQGVTVIPKISAHWTGVLSQMRYGWILSFGE